MCNGHFFFKDSANVQRLGAYDKNGEWQLFLHVTIALKKYTAFKRICTNLRLRQTHLGDGGATL